jgi:dipeptidyl-peptidase 4
MLLSQSHAAKEDGKPGTKDEEQDADTEVEQLPVIFVRDFNVWCKAVEDQELQLTTNGSEEHPYDDSKLFPSPDAQFIVIWHYAPAQDHKVNLVESSPKDQVEPKLQTIQYLKPGDRRRIDRPRLFNAEERCEVPTDDALFKNPYGLTNMGWSKDGKEYRFLFNERGHQHLRVIGINREGIVRVLVEESSNTFIDYSCKLYQHVMTETEELLWASERDGHNHLYLFDLDSGTLKNQVTTGEWNVNVIERIDEKRRRIWFRGYGMVPSQDPYYAHFASVNFDGSGFKVLTDGDGTHTWMWSPDQRYVVDTWSRVDLPPKSVLRDSESGEKLLDLEEGSLAELLATSLNVPERFVAPGRDGKTPIFGIIVRPSSFDPSKKYPILEDIYAGPQDFHTLKAFSPLNRERKWADQGYVLVQLDGMGTNWRSKAFHDVCYKNLKDSGLPDRISWIRAAAKSRPWMDTSRVGVFGSSAGGQSAVAALLWHGDFYKVAAADSGCHDNRMDKLWWNEQWMGYPVDKSYEQSSNVVHAGKLDGKLMLIVGELDTNVDPASTLQLVNALNKADKEYEFLFIPGGGHCCGRSGYALRRQENFFRRHLQSVEDGLHES